MPYKPLCGHRWVERGDKLVCEWCNALGYRRDPTPGAALKHQQIYVYVCSANGCRAPATTIHMTKLYCSRHDKGR